MMREPVDRCARPARHLLLCLGLLLGASGPAPAAEAEGWLALFAAVPSLPVSPAEAVTKISARRVQSEGLGITQLRIEVADGALRGLQKQADQLVEPRAKASAARVQATMEWANRDPVLTEMARKIDKTWRPNRANPGQQPSLDEQRKLDREIERVLGPLPSAASAAAMPRSEIAAYRLELQRATPRASQILQRLSDQQRHYARQHAQADHEALAQLAGSDVAAAARALVARHHALAQQQLADASAILAQAREAVAPRVKRLAELAQAAERRNAPPAEIDEAYMLLKSYLEFLLTLHRETLQDVGFWAGTRVASPLPTAAQATTRSLYEVSFAPGFELHAHGELPLALPYYPIGRAIVVGLAPGIR